jgi:pyruvate kinase
MKKLMTFLSVGVIMTACSDNKDRYIDLSTGKPVEVSKDEKTGYMVNKETNEALYIYVDTKKNDTIYAKTGKVINGHVVYKENNQYVFDEDEKLAVDKDGGVNYKDGDYKMEVEKDGDVKIKDGDKKIKIDGETGERKVKND